MMISNKPFCTMLAVLLTATTSFCAKSEIASIDNAQQKLIFDIIAQDNLKTLTQLTTDVRASKSMDSKGGKKWHEVLTATLEEHLHLNYKDKRRLIFMLFSQYEQINPFERNKVLDVASWQDLEFLCGPKSDVSHYVASKVDRTVTEAGKALFFKKITEPSADPRKLLANQQIIRELYNDQKLFLMLEAEFERFREAESCILSLWQEDIFFDALKQDELHVPGAKGLSQYINNSPFIVEMNAYTKLASSITANALMAITAFVVPSIGIKYFSDGKIDPIAFVGKSYSSILSSLGFSSSAAALQAEGEHFVSGLETSAKVSFFGGVFCAAKYFYDAQRQEKINAAESFIVGPFTGYPALFFPDYLHYIFTFRHCLQTKMIYVAQYIQALKNIAKLSKECPILKAYCPEVAALEDTFTKLSTESEDLEQLLELLQTDTFKGKASILSWYGRSNVAYQLLHKVKNRLIQPMMLIGELDAYLSCVRLMKEYKQQHVPVCFPQYICAEAPTLAILNFWNPSLPAHKAITNSLMIGYSQPQNVIVTGPNAGGKSTTMKGLLVNVILAQTFGIATAESFVFTPFSKIITYLNITDDIAAGKSHFKAGACRAHELIKTAESEKGTGNFTLTAVDEVFNGTTFYEGQAAAYALIEQLSKFPHNMCVTITHFPKVPALEQEYPGLFANYKVTACFDEDGAMSYPYKLEPGVSHQNIAFEILKREGFDATFLDKAITILSANNGLKDA